MASLWRCPSHFRFAPHLWDQQVCHQQTCRTRKSSRDRVVGIASMRLDGLESSMMIFPANSEILLKRSPNVVLSKASEKDCNRRQGAQVIRPQDGLTLLGS
jgi:hypothetical protein